MAANRLSEEEMKDMLAIRGIYDGTQVKPLEEIPYKEERMVIITFLDKREEDLEFDAHTDKMGLAFFAAECRKLKERIRQRGVEDTGDSVEILQEIREERSNK